MVKKTYITPKTECIALNAVENMMALSGVNNDGTSVGFSKNSGDISDAAAREDSGWDVW